MNSSENAKLCSACSGEMIEGRIYANSSGGLHAWMSWKSKEKHIHQKEKFFYIKDRFRTVRKRIGFNLPDWEYNPESLQIESWYCPRCGRVDASFQVEKMDVSQ